MSLSHKYFVCFLATLLSVWVTGCDSFSSKAGSPESSGSTSGGTSNSQKQISAETYFESAVVPAFKTSCQSCHTGLLTSIYVYRPMKRLLLNGSSPELNELIFYTRGKTDHPQTFGRDYCQGDESKSPCFEIRTWWVLENSGSDAGGNSTPLGRVDGVNGYGTVSGWAIDPSSQSNSVVVEFYANGDRSTGTLIGTAVADKPYPGLAFSGNRGYSFSIPDAYRDLVSHPINAYAVDQEDSSVRGKLSGSGTSFRLARMNPAAKAYWENTVVPSNALNRCRECHGNSFDSYYDLFHQYIVDPLPPGVVATDNHLLRTINGTESHGGGNVCGNNAGAPCAQVIATWNCQFNNNCP